MLTAVLLPEAKMSIVSNQHSKLPRATAAAVLGAAGLCALLIGCAADSAPAISSALGAAGVHSTRVAHVMEQPFGLRFEKDGESQPLPRYPVDEITKLFRVKTR